jgi:hypothetical protein
VPFACLCLQDRRASPGEEIHPHLQFHLCLVTFSGFAFQLTSVTVHVRSTGEGCKETFMPRKVTLPASSTGTLTKKSKINQDSHTSFSHHSSFFLRRTF